MLIIEINKFLCESTNEPHAIINSNSLHSIINYDQFVFGHELYPTIEDKISFIVCSIIKNHCFANGNKRTAVIILSILLEANNFPLIAEDRLFNIIINTATHAFDIYKFKTKNL